MPPADLASHRVCIAVYDARPRDGGDGDSKEVDSFVARAERWLRQGLLLVQPSTAQVRAAFHLDRAELTALAAAEPAGSAGLTFLPYLRGERTPNWPAASGVIAGLRPGQLARRARPGPLPAASRWHPSPHVAGPGCCIALRSRARHSHCAPASTASAPTASTIQPRRAFRTPSVPPSQPRSATPLPN